MDIDSNYAFKIVRTQIFSPAEIQTMSEFVNVIRGILPNSDPRHIVGFVESRMSEVIARALRTTNPEIVAKIIDTFAKWAQETYEGKHIASAIGIDAVSSEDGILLDEYLELDLSKVISDGQSSMVVVSKEGYVVKHVYLGSAAEKSLTFAPFPFVPLAQWAQSGRVAIALNRSGEILVFADGVLAFARRRGVWHQFAHNASISQMALHGGKLFTRELRVAAYLSSLDISFARMGGVIGLMKRKASVAYGDSPILPEDRIVNSSTSRKRRALFALIGENKYSDLGRPLRQEIGGIDGATVIDYADNVVAVGAILAIKLSSEQGGRRAAACTLSKYGLGVKISSDGKIEAFSNGKLLFTLA